MTTIERVKKEYRFYSEKEKHNFLMGALAAQKMLGVYDKPLFKMLLELEQYDNSNEVQGLIHEMKQLQESLKPVNKFFTDPTPNVEVKKRISKKEKARQELEELEKRMEQKALMHIKNGGK